SLVVLGREPVAAGVAFTKRRKRTHHIQSMFVYSVSETTQPMRPTPTTRHNEISYPPVSHKTAASSSTASRFSSSAQRPNGGHGFQFFLLSQGAKDVVDSCSVMCSVGTPNDEDDDVGQLAGAGWVSSSDNVQKEGEGQGSSPPFRGSRDHAAAEEPRRPLLSLGTASSLLPLFLWLLVWYSSLLRLRY
ncbi:hypothetical protein BHE74_00035879, partial [Ensete ventricosum]